MSNVAAAPVTASAMLQGLTLENGWTVKQQISRNSNRSGGTFSHSYVAERADGTRGFLKAFDFSEAFEPGNNTIEILRVLTTAYEHERDVLNTCNQKRLSRVVIAIDHGSIQVPSIPGPNGRVFYLVFEMADSDIRAQVDENKRFDTQWTMRALKDVCLGLWQIHKEMIAHQDIKPSNVLIFKNDGLRIADFGRASVKGREVWYDRHSVAGDFTYAPPELLYGYVDPEFVCRRVGCDLYLLGNLAAFMLGGINVTAGIAARIDPQFHWQEWHGSYAAVLPYVQDAFGRLLQDLERSVDRSAVVDAVPLVRELCNPDLSKRGHPRNIGRYDQFSLERYVSTFDRLALKFEVSARIQKKQ